MIRQGVAASLALARAAGAAPPSVAHAHGPQAMACDAAVGAIGKLDAVLARAAVSGKRALLVRTAEGEAAGLSAAASWRKAASRSADESHAERAALAGQ